MIEVIDCVQGTEEWKLSRVGLVTCSELSKVLAKGEGKTRSKYLRQLAGSIITGEPYSGFEGNSHTQRGTEQEPVARDILAEVLDVEITQTGFIKNHDIRLGCSPDGLIGDDMGVEFKSCLPDIQIERLIRGTIPTEYLAQVEGSLLTTQRKKWLFVSYSPGLPMLKIEHTLSDERKELIERELVAFNEELDETVKKIMEMY